VAEIVWITGGHMKKPLIALGCILMALPLVAIFIWQCIDNGLLATLVTWGCALAIVGFILGGGYLILIGTTREE
jgi:hypothetical protein